MTSDGAGYRSSRPIVSPSSGKQLKQSLSNSGAILR